MSVRRTNRFWSVSLEFILFFFKLKFFVKMRLAVSFVGKKNSIFWIYGSKVKGVWSFEEKYGQGMCWSQPTRIDYISPERWAVGIKNLKKTPSRVSSPNFWTLPLYLGRWNPPSLMEHGDLYFFKIYFC